MTARVPADPETLLTRTELADALREVGFPTSPATLATKATRGGGPPFQRYGRIPLYRWGDALTWARDRLGPLIRSTSEADARATAEPAPSEPRPAVVPRIERRLVEAGGNAAAAQGTPSEPRAP